MGSVFFTKNPAKFVLCVRVLFYQCFTTALLDDCFSCKSYSSTSALYNEKWCCEDSVRPSTIAAVFIAVCCASAVLCCLGMLAACAFVPTCLLGTFVAAQSDRWGASKSQFSISVLNARPSTFRLTVSVDGTTSNTFNVNSIGRHHQKTSSKIYSVSLTFWLRVLYGLPAFQGVAVVIFRTT